MPKQSARAGRGAPKREAMSKVDTAWLRMERPTNLMMITGVLMFADRLELSDLRKLIAERFIALSFAARPIRLWNASIVPIPHC